MVTEAELLDYAASNGRVRVAVYHYWGIGKPDYGPSGYAVKQMLAAGLIRKQSSSGSYDTFVLTEEGRRSLSPAASL